MNLKLSARAAANWVARFGTPGIVAAALLASSSVLAMGQPAAGFPVSACQSSAAGTGAGPVPAPESVFATDVPPGLALAPLADAATEEWPVFARGLVMTVRHLTLDPGVTAATRQSQGPVLFYVEAGTLAVSVNGQPQEVGQGGSLLIERSQNYQLRNEDASVPASLLRVQIVPPGGETKVARGDIAMAVDDEQSLAPGPPFIESRLLFTGDVPAVEGLTHIVLGCLTLSAEAGGEGEIVQPGPVALLVLEGELLVGETGALGAGQCTMFGGNAPHRLGASEEAPTVLMIAIMPDGAAAWGAPAGERAPGGRLTFSCEPAAPDEIPDAASGHAIFEERRAAL